jgi:hypothetical protein
MLPANPSESFPGFSSEPSVALAPTPRGRLMQQLSVEKTQNSGAGPSPTTGFRFIFPVGSPRRDAHRSYPSRSPVAPRRLSRSGTRCLRPASIRLASTRTWRSGRHDDRPGLPACLGAIPPSFRHLGYPKCDQRCGELRRADQSSRQKRRDGAIRADALTGCAAERDRKVT